MEEYLRDNRTNELTGKYGCCTIGLKQEWANNIGMNMVWYHNAQSSFLRTTLPQKNALLKSLKSTIHTNRWMLMSRCKPYTGELESKGFIDYRFYDEKEIRYIPDPRQLATAGIEKVLTKEEYIAYKTSRIPVSQNKKSGDALIPEISITFQLSDIRYILFSNENDKQILEKIVPQNRNDIILIPYKRIVEEIIGTNHGIRI